MNAIANTDALTYLRSLPPASMLCQVFFVGVRFAVNPNMARLTKRNQVVNGKSKFWMSSPRLYVVGIKAAIARVRASATYTAVVISRINSTNNGLPLSTRVKALSFWATSIHITRILRAGLAVHPVSRAAQIRLFDRCFLAQFSARFFTVLFPQKRRHGIGAKHIAIVALQIFTSRTSRYAITNKPSVNAFLIAPDHPANVVSAKPFYKVFLSQPCFIDWLLRSLPLGFAINGTESQGFTANSGKFNTTAFAA